MFKRLNTWLKLPTFPRLCRLSRSQFSSAHSQLLTDNQTLVLSLVQAEESLGEATEDLKSSRELNGKLRADLDSANRCEASLRDEIADLRKRNTELDETVTHRDRIIDSKIQDIYSRSDAIGKLRQHFERSQRTLQQIQSVLNDAASNV